MVPCTRKIVSSTRFSLRKLAVFVGHSNVANHIVESPEFWDLLHCLDHRYQVPGRAALKTDLLNVMTELKAKYKKPTKCTDIWSSYLGVMCHFF